jgi:hypothetical protein
MLNTAKALLSPSKPAKSDGADPGARRPARPTSPKGPPAESELFNVPESRSAWPGRGRRFARRAGSARTDLRFLRFNLHCFATRIRRCPAGRLTVSRHLSQQGFQPQRTKIGRQPRSHRARHSICGRRSPDPMLCPCGASIKRLEQPRPQNASRPANNPADPTRHH